MFVFIFDVISKNLFAIAEIFLSKTDTSYWEDSLNISSVFIWSMAAIISSLFVQFLDKSKS